MRFILYFTAIAFVVCATQFAWTQDPQHRTTADLPEAPTPALPSVSTTVQVIASPEEIAQAQVHIEEQQRMLGVFPNFYISYVPDPVPLTPRQKFSLAARTLVDPVSLALTGVTAGAQQASHDYAWGQGASAYGKRFGAAYGTMMTSTLIGSAALPVLFHQDPRFFYKSTGSIPSKFLYAVVTSVICKGDNHRWQPNVSAIGGGMAAAALSNLYYPASDRASARQIFIGAGVGSAFTAVTNVIEEFASHKLTPHAAPTDLPTLEQDSVTKAPASAP